MTKLKTAILLSLSVMLLLFACNGKRHDTVIKGNIANLDEYEILVSYFIDDSIIVDTVFSTPKGYFSYKCSIDTLTSFSLYFNDQSSTVLVYANPLDRVTVKGDALVPDLINVNGNDINDGLTEFKETYSDLLLRRNFIYNTFRNVSPNDTIQNTKAFVPSDEEATLNNINLELKLAAEEFIEKNPDRLSSLILINEFFANSDNPELFERVMGFLKAGVLKTKMGLNLDTYLKKVKKSAEGVAMPYFQLIDIKGDTINSYDYKGKYLLLSFVSSTGSDSRETIKRLKDTYKNINKDSVEFISIYIDSNIHPNEIIESDSVDWRVVPEKRSWASDIVDAYNIEFVPNNILISPKGVISTRNISASAVAKELKSSTKNDQ